MYFQRGSIAFFALSTWAGMPKNAFSVRIYSVLRIACMDGPLPPQDPPNRPRSPEEINGLKLRRLAWEFDNFLEAWRFGVF